MEQIQNRTFDEIEVGDSASLVRTLTYRDIELFAVMSGDVNPMHVDAAFAKSDHFHQVVAHGMWGGSLISTLLGTQLPGPGTIYLDQSLRFVKPVLLGDTVVTTEDNSRPVTRQLADVVELHGGSAVALQEVPLEKVSRYGILGGADLAATLRAQACTPATRACPRLAEPASRGCPDADDV